MVQKIEKDVSDRVGIIGCSQLGALLNESKYGTPYTVYEQFIGQDSKEFTEQQKESMAMGTVFEDTIARFGAEKFGVKLRKSNKAYVHKRIPEFICHPDRLVVGKINGKRIVINYI